MPLFSSAATSSDSDARDDLHGLCARLAQEARMSSRLEGLRLRPDGRDRPRWSTAPVRPTSVPRATQGLEW